MFIKRSQNFLAKVISRFTLWNRMMHQAALERWTLMHRSITGEMAADASLERWPLRHGWIDDLWCIEASLERWPLMHWSITREMADDALRQVEHRYWRIIHKCSGQDLPTINLQTPAFWVYAATATLKWKYKYW